MKLKKVNRLLALACAAAVTASGFCPAAPVKAKETSGIENTEISEQQEESGISTQAEDSTENMILYWSDDLEETTAVSGEELDRTVAGKGVYEREGGDFSGQGDLCVREPVGSLFEYGRIGKNQRIAGRRTAEC